MSQEIIVLGAGMVGVGVAYHLARRGHQVLLVDRREPGRETSFGNAGLIQREAVQPHPFPRDLANLWRVLPNRSIDIRYRTGAMVSEASPLMQYWRHSAPAAYARIVPEYAALIMHCTSEHEQMFEAASAQSLIRRDGWLEVYRSADLFEQRLIKASEFHQRFGVEFNRCDEGKLAELEPDLSDAAVGAIHWTNTWSVSDPGALVGAYAQAFKALGGRIVQAEARDMRPASAGWRLDTDGGAYEGEQLVLATGPWSNEWLAQLSYRLPLFHMRGYHMHYAARNGARLNYGLMDFEKGYLLTPKRAGIRLTTGAELNTLEAPPRSGQLEAAEAQAKTLFPLGERLEPQPWKGARPCMADMKPVIGPAPKHEGLWFAFGHGHQGFTLGPLTGRLIGEMIDDEPTLINMAPYRADRF